MRNLAELSDGRVAEVLSKLEGYVQDELQLEGITGDREQLTFEADLRYAGQSQELALQLRRDALSGSGLLDLAEQFAALYERRHGFRLDQPIELMNLRAVGTVRTGTIEVPRHDLEGEDPTAAMLGQRRVYFNGQTANANVYDRQRLRAGNVLHGPAMITQVDSTTVVHPHHAARIDEYLNILITPDGPSA
jgi:N-methylhydantoinase A